MTISGAGAFVRVNRRFGRPCLRAIKPFSEWLPDGYSYNRSYDRFEDAGGSPLADSALSTHWTYDLVLFVPNSNDETLPILIASGVVETGSRSVIIKSDKLTILKDAWRLVIGDERFILQSHVEQADWVNCVLSRMDTYR